MQRDKTIQFWDNYHDENDSEEWISKPGEEILRMIFDQIYTSKENQDDQKFRCQKRRFSILEIGCGTSTLIRDLKRYIEEQHPMIEVVACGTDVSKVCIDVNIKRDCAYTHPTSAAADEYGNKNANNGIDKTNNSRISLWYEVLNVLDGVPSRQNWDLIIDKGCLDTFVFRSRQRGIQNKNYPESLRILLDNIHGWQSKAAISESAAIGDDKQYAELLVNKDDNSLTNDEERTNQQLQQPRGTPGVYIWITPRPKLKAVRDYAGFSSVTRYALPKTYRSRLEGKKNSNKGKEAEEDRYDGNGDNYDGESQNAASPGFMFVCTKNNDYQVGISIPFPTVNSGSDNSNQPNNEKICPRCKISFQQFRKEEGIEFRGVAYCARKWKSHCIHCKSLPVYTNQHRKYENLSIE